MLDGETTHRKSFVLPPKKGEVMAMDLQKVKTHSSIHPFIHHQSSSKILSSISENDNDGQAL